MMRAMRRYFDTYEKVDAELHRQAVDRQRRVRRASVRRSHEPARARARSIGRSSRRAPRTTSRSQKTGPGSDVLPDRHHVRAEAASISRRSTPASSCGAATRPSTMPTMSRSPRPACGSSSARACWSSLEVGQHDSARWRRARRSVAGGARDREHQPRDRRARRDRIDQRRLGSPRSARQSQRSIRDDAARGHASLLVHRARDAHRARSSRRRRRPKRCTARRRSVVQRERP